MARPFSGAEVKRIINEHQDIIDSIDSVIESTAKYRTDIQKASDLLVTKEVMKILRDIPVDEINREKQGFRVKALKANGYHTIADLASVSVDDIASVYGISEESAYSIKQVVNDIVSKARQGVKIRLSTDNQSKEATQLVVALSHLTRSKTLEMNCRKFQNKYLPSVTSAIKDLKKASNGLKWFFLSYNNKQQATAAFDYLTKLINGDYCTAAEKYYSQFQSVNRIFPKEAWQDFSDSPILFFNELEEITPGLLGNDDSVYGLPDELARKIQDEPFSPDGLLCTLRRYQEWGVKYILHQERVLLGDEMGLGKTVQAIAAMVSLQNTGATHFIVVCPASVLANWCREIRKMSLLSVTKIHGSNKRAALSSWLKTGGIAVTTFETTAILSLPDEFRFSMLVVDEAHYIKNPNTKRTKTVKELCLHTDRLLFMTGTALENKVDEMISLIGILQPQIASQVHGMESLSIAPQFRKIVAPVYYRRKREDVLTELPDLIEAREWCTLGPIEEEIYEKTVLTKNFAAIRQVSWNVESLKNSSKAVRLIQLIDEATSDGRKVIVFSFFLDTIGKISQMLGSNCIGPITGSVSPNRRQEILDQFEKAPAGTVLVAQIQSGGTGLNIQTASVVILCEPQFKPSTENQAISRAYRMGQTRNVLVYRLLCENTVEEKMMERLENKQKTFDAFADKSEAAMETREIDDQAFGNIIQEEIERINAKKGVTSE